MNPLKEGNIPDGFVHHPVGSARLGDTWMCINKLHHISMVKGTKSHVVSVWNPKRNRIAECVEEVVGLIDGPAEFTLTEDPPNDGFGDVYLKKGWPFFPTKKKWKSGPWNRICYQFDGASAARKKNPPTECLPRLVDFVEGVEFVRLGKHMSLEENVRIMSESDCFLGIDSGFSHVSHSVGVPRFLIEYNYNFSGRHSGRPYFFCKGTDDAITQVRNFMISLG
jgi:hypothetical protein